MRDYSYKALYLISTLSTASNQTTLRMAMSNKTVTRSDKIPILHNNTSAWEGSVLFKQLNLQKSELATTNLISNLVKWSDSSVLVFLQEPWTPKSGKISSLPRGTQMFSVPNAMPRSVILATPDNIWQMADYTTKDTVSCTWKTGNALFPEIIIVSVYSDIKKDTIPIELKNVAK